MKRDMTKTMRIMMLLLLTMVGAGQMWAETDEPSNIKRGTITGGSIAFYADEACTSDFESDVAANATVYVKATPEPGNTAIGVIFTAKKGISTDAMQAPRRSAEGPGIAADITVSAVTGKPGIYQFTMPNAENTNVTITASFAEPEQQQVSYVDETGESQTVNAYVLDETMCILPAGFYAVPDGVITFSHNLSIAGDVSLILKDGATMTAATIDGSEKLLTVYAQTEQTGQMVAAAYECGVALGQRFVAYNMADATNISATAIVSGSVTDLTTINGKTLKPLDGNYVSVNAADFTFSGSTSTTSPFTITTGEGETATTTHYYIYKKDNTVTLSYTGRGMVQVTGLPEGYATVENEPMQRTFTMPATDVVLTATAVTDLTATSVTYDGTARTPEIKQGDDVFDAANYTIAYKLGNDDVTADDVKDANTYTCTLTGVGQYVGTTTVSLTIDKANYHEPEDIQNITKYVPQDKAGSYTMALPSLPEGAAYSFTKTDEGDVIATHSYDAEHNTLTVATNSGTTGGTTATITVEAAGAPNYNDYSFTLNVVVSEYTTAYEWPKQTNIWLDADNELVWAEGGNTLDTSLLTVKKNGSAVTNYTAKVGETVLTAGENLLTLAPGAYRIAITGDDGKLDDWVDFKVIKLIENDQDLTLSVHDWTYPDLARTGGTIDWDAIVGSVKYGDTTIELSKNDISRGNGIDNESLRLWFTNADRPHGTESVFMTKEMTVEDFYYPGGTRFQITPFGSVVDVGSWNVYLPNHVTVKQLLDDDGNPVPAGDNGGKIYYMCNSRPDLHVEQSESEVGGQTVTELTLYNGDTPVTEGYYFRNGDDFYYGNGENAYKAYGGNDGFISFWPVKSYAKGTVYLMGNKPVTNVYTDKDYDGVKETAEEYTLACGMMEFWPDYNGTIYVGKNYITIGGNFLYTGNVTPSVHGSEIWIGDAHIDMGNQMAIAWLPDDEIDGSLASDEYVTPHAYARYKADDYHYHIADCEFLIYPNNSLITIQNVKPKYYAGEDAEIVVELRQINRGMSVFVNGTNHRFTGNGEHTLTITDLREGTYFIDIFGDGDEYVTPFSTSTSFQVVKTAPVLTLTGKQNTAGEAFETGAEIEYDPENPIVVNAVNDKAVSGTNWKWTISNTDVVTQHHIVNESQQNAVNSEDIYLNTIGLGEVTLTARFSGNEIYNPARKSITFKVVPKAATLFAANSTNLWATFCDIYERTVPDDCTAYTISSISGSTVTLSDALTTTIPAYTPVLVKRESSELSQDVKAKYNADGTVPANYNSTTGIVTSTGSDFTFYGNSSNTAVSSDDFKGYYNEGQTYLLYDGKFILADENGGLGAHKCLLVLNGTNNAPVLSIGTETTSLSPVPSPSREGSSQRWYTLDGRKLNGKPTQKGIYVNGGRKVVIK